MLNLKLLPNLVKKIVTANVSQLGLRLPTSPLKITLALTYHCIFQCKICGIWRLYQESPEKIENELTLQDYCKLFSSLNSWNPLYLEFIGGEPFLRNDIESIIIESVRRIKTLNLCSITTNGFNPSLIKEKILRIRKHISSKTHLTIGVSLDGTPAVHNFLKGQKHAWETAYKTFTALHEIADCTENITTHFCYTINSYNAGKLREFYLDLKKHNNIQLSKISIALEHHTSYFNNPGYSPLSQRAVDQDVHFYINQIKQERVKTDFSLIDTLRKLFYLHYVSEISNYIRKKSCFKCSASTLSAFIDPYGDMFPCLMWNQKIGNIKRDSFDHLWLSTKHEKIREKIRNGTHTQCWTPCEVQPSMLLSLQKSLSLLTRTI